MKKIRSIKSQANKLPKTLSNKLAKLRLADRIVLLAVVLVAVVAFMAVAHWSQKSKAPQLAANNPSVTAPVINTNSGATAQPSSPAQSSLPTYDYSADCSNVTAINSTSSLFTSKNEPTLSFEFPSSWKVSNQGNKYNPGDICEFTSPDGAVNLIWQSAVSGLGGSCVSPPPSNLQVTINNATSTPDAPGLSTISYSYSGYVGVAVVPTLSDFAKLGISNTCSNVFYPLFTSHSSSNSLSLQAIMKSDVGGQDLQTVTALLQSLKY